MRLVAALAVLLGEVEGLGGERERTLGRPTPRCASARRPAGSSDWP